MHDILTEARTLIGENDTFEAIGILQGFVSSQLGDQGAFGRRFTAYRNEILLHSAGLNDLYRNKRSGIEEPGELNREERRLRKALLGLIDDIDRSVSRAQGPIPTAPVRADISMPEGEQLEKIWGRNTLQSLSWLHQGLKAGRSVCRVVAPTGIGTGFLASGGYVITNNHVVEDAAIAEDTRIEFNFERDEAGNMCQSTIYDVDPSSFLTEPAPLDCTVLKIAASPNLPPIEDWGTLPLETTGKVKVGEPVTIIQHPNGGEKQIALTANEVVNIYEHRLHYMTDTMRGSSGSPVFNSRWQVVALHRAGGNRIKNASGARMFANEGVLMSHLIEIPGMRDRLGH